MIAFADVRLVLAVDHGVERFDEGAGLRRQPRIEGDDRQALKEAMDALTIPDDMGVIIRTAAQGARREDFVRELASEASACWERVSAFA